MYSCTTKLAVEIAYSVVSVSISTTDINVLLDEWVCTAAMSLSPGLDVLFKKEYLNIKHNVRQSVYIFQHDNNEHFDFT